jgi:hypothetical protein
MNLNDTEKKMLQGEMGEPRRLALEHQIKVGRFFDAEDMVEVGHVHIMADTEALGEAGVAFLEEMAGYPEADRRVLVPTVTDPRGADFKAYERIRHDKAFVEFERRAVEAFRALDVLMTDTCINYQIFMPPVFGEHVAFGDTGSSIYTNSVLGARTNFEGGPSALAAALTGRTPRYGYHLDSTRRGRTLFRADLRPRTLSDWGALGGIVGREMRSYWEVPVIDGIRRAPTSDELKHFGAALASFGSTPLFHMIGVTPEVPSLEAVFDGAPPAVRPITGSDIDAFYDAYLPEDDELHVVVFSAPQLSLVEMQSLAYLLDGKRVHGDVTLIACTAPEVKAAADRMGLGERIEAAGGIVLEGVCFYNMHAREIGEANGWCRLMSNSAKIVNILGGYGYEPVLASMARCVDSAVAGKILR